MRTRIRTLFAAVVLALAVGAATFAIAQNTSNYMAQGGATWVIGGVLDSTTGTVLIANGADAPATCTVGQLFISTDETVDTNCTTTVDNSLCVCHATNTWATTE